MSKKPNEKELQEKKEKIHQTVEQRNRFRLVIIIFILGIIVFAALYFNFTQLYKLNIPENKVKSGVMEAISNINNGKATGSNFRNVTIPKATDQGPIEQIDNNCLKQINCLDLLNFTQEYFLLKNNITKNEDFSNQAETIFQYQIKSDPLERSLKNLVALAPNNYSYEYLKKEFNILIKIMYKNTKQYFILDPRNYILVRKIDEEAIKHEDLDKIVFLTNQALNDNNLRVVLDNLNKLPSNTEDVNSFKQKIINKINLENSFLDVENILLNKPDCNIVSK